MSLSDSDEEVAQAPIRQKKRQRTSDVTDPYHGPWLIRPAGYEDRKGILDMLSESFAPFKDKYPPAAYEATVMNMETLTERMKEQHVLVAVSGRGVLGSVSWYLVPGKNEKEAHIRGMGILKDQQGSGLAQDLLARVEEDVLRVASVEVISLDTTDVLQRAQAFYVRMGYKRTGNVQDFHGIEIIEFVKQLPARTSTETASLEGGKKEGQDAGKKEDVNDDGGHEPFKTQAGTQ